jgi:hypothetical protein
MTALKQIKHKDRLSGLILRDVLFHHHVLPVKNENVYGAIPVKINFM